MRKLFIKPWRRNGKGKKIKNSKRFKKLILKNADNKILKNISLQLYAMQ